MTSISIEVNKVAQLEGHIDNIYALASAPDERYFYSAGGDGYIAIWDFETLKDAQLLVRVPCSVYAFQVLTQGQHLLIGQRLGGVHVVDLLAKRETHLLQAHQASIFSLAQTSKLFFAGSADGSISVWNILDEGFALAQKLTYSIESVRSLAVSPNQKHLAAAYSDQTIRIFDVDANFSLIYQLRGHNSSVFCVHYSPDGRYLLSGSRDAHLKRWSVQEAYTLDRSLPAHWFTINELAFSPNGNYLATASRDKTIRIWQADDLKLLKVIDYVRNQSHRNSVNTLCWSGNGMLLTAGDDKKVMVWDLSLE